MKTVGITQANTHFLRLLAEVAGGETVTITKHGTPVAQLVPPPEAPRKDVRAAIETWLAYRKDHNIRLDGLTIREMIEDGRRY